MFGLHWGSGESQAKPVEKKPVWTGWKNFKVLNKETECEDVIRFNLVPEDGAMPDFKAGQSIGIRTDDYAPRAFTLCGTPADGCYRLVVKRFTGETGKLAQHLCQNVRVGDTLEVSEPVGAFTLVEGETPLVMIAEGIGITAIVSLLSEIATREPLRRVHVVYATKNGSNFPLREELKRLMTELPNAGLAVFYSEPHHDERAGRDFDVHGKLDISLLRAVCLEHDADFYLCGSEKSMEEVRKAIHALKNVPESRIHEQIYVAKR